MEFSAMIKIAPSLLSADFANLEDQVKCLEQSGADMLHLDIMDGQFVPNLSFGVPILKSLRSKTKLIFDTHLMVNSPQKMIPWFADCGSDIITFHAEAVSDLHQTIDAIHSYGIKAGIALKPSTPHHILKDIIDKIDLILVMTVEPGFGGQTFMENQLPKIQHISQLIHNKNIILSVDGRINQQSAVLAKSNGANALVAGTYIFQGSDWAKNINSLR